MNKVVVKYKSGHEKEINTKLSDDAKIIKFLKITGDWSDDVLSFEVIEDIKSAYCNYQNLGNESV
ncbi:MAG: hypothetical protein ABFR62_07830 [Bacteroidota bacterium]